MRRVLLIALLASALALSLGVAVPAHAADTTTNTSAALQFTPNIPIPGLFPEKGTSVEVDETLVSKYIRAIYIYFVGVVGVIAVVMVMYAGFLWITAAGNTSKVQEARDQMNAAVIGLILTLTSYLLLSLINPKLLTLRIPFINPVEHVVQSTLFCANLPDGVHAVGTENTCGERYEVQGSGTVSASSKYCYGNDCSAFGANTVCAPQGGGTFKCVTPSELCEGDRPDGTGLDEWCNYADGIIAKTPGFEGYGCAKQNLSFSVIFNPQRDSNIVGKDRCVFGKLLTCDTNHIRRDCTYGATPTKFETACWDKNKPRTYPVPATSESGWEAQCQSTENTRPVYRADAICCVRPATKEFAICADKADKLTYVTVDCASLNDQPGTFASGETTCSSTCWIPAMLDWSYL